MDQEDLEITDLRGLPRLQQMMLDGRCGSRRGFALVQRTGRGGRADYEEAFRERPSSRRSCGPEILDVGWRETWRSSRSPAGFPQRLERGTPVAIRRRRPEAGPRNDLRSERQGDRPHGGRTFFVAGATSRNFTEKTADVVDALAWKNISVFTELENLSLPSWRDRRLRAGRRQRTPMSAHYRIVTENALLGQPEVKLGSSRVRGMQRLPRLIGPSKAAEICVNGEPVDGSTAVSLGWADEFVPSSASLSGRSPPARDFAAGNRPLPRREWDALAGRWKEELASSSPPGSEGDPRCPDPGKETGEICARAACGGPGRLLA